MLKAMVLSVRADHGTFVCETTDGVCAIFIQRSGPVLQAGDILGAGATFPDVEVLEHSAGTCSVEMKTGPVSRAVALEMHGNRL